VFLIQLFFNRMETPEEPTNGTPGDQTHQDQEGPRSKQQAKRSYQEKKPKEKQYRAKGE
jgi:hypothetical protein